jgi:hypothetical protein
MRRRHPAVARAGSGRARRRMAERVGFVDLRATRYGGSHRVSEPTFVCWWSSLAGLPTVARSRVMSEGWRRGWDSNPRAGYPTRRFRGAPVTTTSVPLRFLALAAAASRQFPPTFALIRMRRLPAVALAKAGPAIAVQRFGWQAGRSLRLASLRSHVAARCAPFAVGRSRALLRDGSLPPLAYSHRLAGSYLSRLPSKKL